MRQHRQHDVPVPGVVPGDLVRARAEGFARLVTEVTMGRVSVAWRPLRMTKNAAGTLPWTCSRSPVNACLNRCRAAFNRGFAEGERLRHLPRNHQA
jgi:hypothetical protein